MDKRTLDNYRHADINSCDPLALTDLRDIKIDTTLSINQRIESFLSQVQNPYLFRIGDVVIKVNYRKGKTFSDAFQRALLNGK